MKPFQDVIPQDVPGCKWNYVEAPQGLRPRASLKSMLINNINYAKFWVSFSLSLIKLSDPQTIPEPIPRHST
jgi:hypothetical protein